MKNTIFFCLFLVVLIFLSGCKPIIEKKHVFNPPDEEIPATTIGSGHVFFDKGVVFVFGIGPHGRSWYETDQNIIHELHGPYKPYFDISVDNLPEKDRIPVDLKITKGNVAIFKKDGTTRIFDLTQIDKQAVKYGSRILEKDAFVLDESESGDTIDKEKSEIIWNQLNDKGILDDRGRLTNDLPNTDMDLGLSQENKVYHDHVFMTLLKIRHNYEKKKGLLWFFTHKPSRKYNYKDNKDFSSLALWYTNVEVLKTFISENVIHAETEKVVCDVEFDVEYANGLIKTYQGEIVQVPYYQEREASRAEFF